MLDEEQYAGVLAELEHADLLPQRGQVHAGRGHDLARERVVQHALHLVEKCEFPSKPSNLSEHR